MDLLRVVAELPAFEAVTNEVCKNHTIMAIKHLTMGSYWAIKMLDSSTKFPEGVLAGGFTDLGNFDECVTLDVKEEWGSFKGQHCLASIDVNLGSPLKETQSTTQRFTGAICVPSTCTSEDVSDFLTGALLHNVMVNPKGCHTLENRPFHTMDWVAIGIISFTALLCILSTIYDIATTDPKRRKDSLLAFSLYTNGKQLLKTKSTEGQMECLHGLRFLTIAWVIIGHTYFMSVTIPTVNTIALIQDMRTWGHEVVTGALTAVDTFFFLSGLLLCYIFLKTMNKGKKFSITQFWLHRYIRITPMLGIVILVHTGLILHLCSGPLWDLKMSRIPEICKKHWWTAILHIQNYFRPLNMCLPVTWYLSVDMQLYILSPLLLIPLYKRPRTGIIMIQVLTLGSILACFLQLLFDDDATPIVKLGTQTPDNYFYTHTRATPWFFGLTTGYVLFKTTEWRKDIEEGIKEGLSKVTVTIGWTLALICLVTPVVCTHFFTQEEPLGVWYTTSFTTFSRVSWSLGLSWLVFACVSGYGGPVNVFLSWKFFQPLSRLTYSIYIIHMAFIRVKLYSTKAPTYYSDANKIMEIFSTLVFVTLLAIPTSLMFEYPTIILEKTLQSGRKKKPVRRQPSPPEVTESSQKTDTAVGFQGETDSFNHKANGLHQIPLQTVSDEGTAAQNGTH